jgi:ATP-dependent exoDNAse (exonuclease V) beta subunit
MENITKQNGDIAFIEETHCYYDVTNPEAIFTSVTTMIHNYTQPFDGDFWASYKALEKILPFKEWSNIKSGILNTHQIPNSLSIDEKLFQKEKQQILDTCEKEKNEACERGTKIHADLENSFYEKKTDIQLSKYEVGGKFECKKGYNKLDLENGIYPEYLIYNKKLGLAGQIDLLIKKGNKIIVLDWKSNKEIKTKSFFNQKTKSSVKMKYPLNNLEDCNYWHYTMQLSTYAWMLQQINPEFEIEDLVLVHFDHNNKQTVYHLPYLKKEVISMIKDFKRDLIISNNRKKRQPIEY